MRISFAAIILFTLYSCKSRQKADQLFYNGTIYTLDSARPQAEALVVHDGKILAVGTASELKGLYQFEKEIDLKGQYMYPGFHDAHAHFYGLGKSISELDLGGCRSWDEVLYKTKTFAGKSVTDSTRWILGRGWDQNLWPVKEFPDKSKLDSLFPYQPVFIKRIDG